MKSSDLSVLFLSCDKYSDLWKPLFFCIDKYWGDCPYPMYLGSNTKKFTHKRVQTILSGPDHDWSTSFLTILAQVPTRYIFLWLDDILPISMIDSDNLATIFHTIRQRKFKHVHIFPIPHPDTYTPDGLGVYEKGQPYRVNALGFWEVEHLTKLLLPGENAWNFEIMGSYRSSYTDGYYCLTKPVFEKIHLVEKGKYFPKAVEYCTSHAIPIDRSSREVLRKQVFLKSEIQKILFNCIIRIHWKIRVLSMNMLRRIFISY